MNGRLFSPTPRRVAKSICRVNTLWTSHENSRDLFLFVNWPFTRITGFCIHNVHYKKNSWLYKIFSHILSNKFLIRITKFLLSLQLFHIKTNIWRKDNKNFVILIKKFIWQSMTEHFVEPTIFVFSVLTHCELGLNDLHLNLLKVTNVQNPAILVNDQLTKRNKSREFSWPVHTVLRAVFVRSIFTVYSRAMYSFISHPSQLPHIISPRSIPT